MVLLVLIVGTVVVLGCFCFCRSGILLFVFVEPLLLVVGAVVVLCFRNGFIEVVAS